MKILFYNFVDRNSFSLQDYYKIIPLEGRAEPCQAKFKMGELSQM